MTDEIKRAVASKVHKEYKSFIDNVVKRGARYAIENSLMISFYSMLNFNHPARNEKNHLTAEACSATMVK